MDWSFLKLKKAELSSGDGTPPPFFNVMPKAVVQEPLGEPSVHPVAAASVPQSTPQQPVTWAAPKATSAPTIASLLTPGGIPAASANRPSSGPTAVEHVPNLPPRGWQVLGGVFALVFAFVAIWYAYATFGGGTQIFDGIEKLWKRVPPIVEKKPNISEASPNFVPTVVESTAEWRTGHFGSADCAECSDAIDVDSDGAVNGVEFSAQTDPNNPDTDGDGLADGDEIAVFVCDPTNKYTAKNNAYTDADYMKGGWDCVFSPVGDVRLSDARKAHITEKIKQFTLHEPSITTLGSAVGQFGMPAVVPTQSPSSVPGGATTAEMKLEHDTDRVITIKKVAAALVAYKQQLGGYPQVSSFGEMVQKIKPFLGDGGSVVDPVNIRPMTYEYQLNQNGNSFLLTYYSETQQQIVRYTESKALLEGGAEDLKARDAQRTKDLEKIRAALLIYSTATAAASETFSFPVPSQVESKLSPQYISSVPRDPLTKQLYSYEASDDGGTFTLKALFEKPAAGKTGYLCNQEECRAY
ncbi:MAG: hypothetical protein KBD66_00960 [Candidatus Doudnabacteria bacterium]|nr:hypothetical protein [Candidatus Doudnabacteria bacterium]